MCSLHSIGCGSAVIVGDKLVCKWEVQEIVEGYPEEVVQVHKLSYNDGLPMCHVGYLPKRMFAKHDPKWFDLLFLRVVHDYRDSDSSHERSRSYCWHGLILCEIIKDNNRYNGRNPFDGESCDVSVNNHNNVLYDIEQMDMTAKIPNNKKRKKGEKRVKKRWETDSTTTEEQEEAQPKKGINAPRREEKKDDDDSLPWGAAKF